MLNKIFIFILVVIVIGLSISFAQETSENNDAVKDITKTIDLVAGLDKILRLDFVPDSRVKVSNENLVSIQVVPQKKEIVLTGQKQGEATLTVRDVAGDVRAIYLLKITSSDQSRVVMQLKDLIGDVEGLEIGIKGDAVYVGGQIVVPGDIGRVVVILDKYPEVLRLVELSPQTQQVIARKMQDEMQKSSLKDVTVRVVNGTFWIEGIVNSKEESDKAEQIARAYLPDQIQNLARRVDAVQSTKKPPFENLLTISTKPKPEPLPKLYKITAQFVELTKGYDRLFNFTWAPTLGGSGGQIQIGKGNSGGVTTSSSDTLAATISNLFPKLASAKSAGHARVIESGVVVVKENTLGSIKKTVTIPYTVGTGDNMKSGSATAGFNMVVTPTMLQEEKINLKLTINVSSATGDNPPQTLDNTIDTSLVVKSQESAVIGGVVTNKTSTDFDKDGSPSTTEGGFALFSFIKSKKYSSNKSQFVMFITPEVIESAANGTLDIEKKFRKRSR